MEDFSVLGSLSLRLHQEFVRMFYLLLPVFFMIAIAVDWFRNPAGSPDFLDTLKRAFVATLLVVGFQEISEAILAISSGIADKISDMSGLDSIIKMAGEKAGSYTKSSVSLVLAFDDMVIAFLSFASYIVLYIARYITVALYHFMWIFLSILSPILIVFHLFRGTSQITVNLFKSLIEVASYKIVWAVLSAMITALAFGNAYAADGNYLTVILLNFVIALAMLGTPLVVKSLVGGGLSTMAETLGMGAVVAMVSAPSKTVAALKMGREVLSDTKGFAGHYGAKMQPHLPGLQGVQAHMAPSSSVSQNATPSSSHQAPPRNDSQKLNGGSKK